MAAFLNRNALAALLRFIVLAIVMLGGVADGLAQADSPRARLTAAKQALDALQTAVEKPNVNDDGLQQLRAELDPVRSALIALQSDVIGPRDASRVRLDKLGPAPKDGEPPETNDVAEVRKREAGIFGELDSVAREAQLEVTRADQLANRITQLRRDSFARQITERSASVLDPSFWADVAGELPRLAALLGGMSADTWTMLLRNGWWEALLTAAIASICIYVLHLIRVRLFRLRDRVIAMPNAPRRFVAAANVVAEVILALLGWPLWLVVVIMAFDLTKLLQENFTNIVLGTMVGALIVAMVFNAVGRGILAVHTPDLRLLPLSDWAVRRIQRRVRWTSYVLFASVWLQAIATNIFAPVSVTVALSALTALGLATTMSSTLLRLRAAPLAPEEIATGPIPNPLDFMRPILWVVVVAILSCLGAGYIALASFIGLLCVILIFLACVIHVLTTLIDSGLTDGLATDGQRGRTIASAVGVSPKNVAFAATLLSGLLRFVVLAGAALLLTSPLGIYSVDVFSTIERAFFGFQIGGITISPSTILTAVFLFFAVLVVTRLVRSWVRHTLLPRTTLDAGLQNSIATVIGYAGAILALVVGLSEVGLDLQNVAIIAGALSVGIGIGLQAIVGNFVSGLILLAERPIRVGDIISVKGGEEGYVRRISVRATEIETYDRATLIVPNQELVTGVVKNWIYDNSWARTRILLKLGYDADVDAVQKIMLEAAADDPRILPTPRPRVFLTNMTDTALEFELVVILASVETVQPVRSDLHMKIVRAFRAAGIRMAAQLPAVPAPVVVSLDEALAATRPKRAEDADPGSKPA